MTQRWLVIQPHHGRAGGPRCGRIRNARHRRQPAQSPVGGIRDPWVFRAATLPEWLDIYQRLVVRDIRGGLITCCQAVVRQHDQDAWYRAHRAGQLGGVADLVGHGLWFVAGLVENRDSMQLSRSRFSQSHSQWLRRYYLEGMSIDLSGVNRARKCSLIISPDPSELSRILLKGQTIYFLLWSSLVLHSTGQNLRSGHRYPRRCSHRTSAQHHGTKLPNLYFARLRGGARGKTGDLTRCFERQYSLKIASIPACKC